MKQAVVYLFLFINVIVAGCNANKSVADFGLSKESSIKVDKSTASSNPKKLETTKRKLIKEGTIEFETDTMEATRKTVFNAVEAYKAYVVSDQLYNYNGRESNALIIRVPSTHFDELTQEIIKGVNKFETKQIKTKDVSEEFVDVAARLKTRKKLEVRYLELLKKAETVSEILEIEKQIGALRSEIESVEGRLRYLESQIEYSTLNLTFFERVPVDNKFAKQFKNGFRNGWENLIWFLVAMINIWPFLLITIALFWAIKRYKVKRKTLFNKTKT